MTHRKREQGPRSIVRWLHTSIGAIGVVVGFQFADTGVEAELLVLGSIAYGAWLARRPAGLVLALSAGMLDVLQRASSIDALMHSLPRVMLYVVTALATSAIETATRPKGQ